MDLNTNTGVIFKNENKTKETQPDYRGEIDVNGERKSIALWVKTPKSDKGRHYFSVSIGEPYRPSESSNGSVATQPDEPPF